MFMHEAMKSIILSGNQMAARHKSWAGKRRIEYDVVRDVVRCFNWQGRKVSQVKFIPYELIDTRWELVPKDLFA